MTSTFHGMDVAVAAAAAVDIIHDTIVVSGYRMSLQGKQDVSPFHH